MKISRPRIVESKKDRWYISLYITLETGRKKRKRIYSPRELGIITAGYGNRTGTSVSEKRAYFSWLLEQVSLKIKSGWEFEENDSCITLKGALEKAATLIQHSGSGKKHKSTLEYWRRVLMKYFSYRYKIYNSPIESLDHTHIAAFLTDTCGSSNGYFNNLRKQVSALFGLMIKHGIMTKNPVAGISSRKHIPVKNKAFTPEQIKPLLEYCKTIHFHLYVALVMEFTLLLRPHSEIRRLSRGMFNKDFTVLKIPAGYTKGARSRKLPVNSLTQKILFELGADNRLPEENIFSKRVEPHNPEYFATRWGRFKKKAELKGLIHKDQTLYSMRHSAALYVYEQSKSIKKVQKLMDHSDVKTTFAYMRSLGIDNDKLELDDMPRI